MPVTLNIIPYYEINILEYCLNMIINCMRTSKLKLHRDSIEDEKMKIQPFLDEVVFPLKTSSIV